jgi:hypothetical protein
MVLPEDTLESDEVGRQTEGSRQTERRATALLERTWQPFKMPCRRWNWQLGTSGWYSRKWSGSTVHTKFAARAKAEGERGKPSGTISGATRHSARNFAGSPRGESDLDRGM